MAAPLHYIRTDLMSPGFRSGCLCFVLVFISFTGMKRFHGFPSSSNLKVCSFAACVYIPRASSQIAVNHKSTRVEDGFVYSVTVSLAPAAASQRQRTLGGRWGTLGDAGGAWGGRRGPLLSTRLSPRSQFFPPNPSGQSQLKEPHRFTQVPPFRHGLVLQKCLLAEQPGPEGQEQM